MHFTVLGCRSGMPADGQASSGYMVSAGNAAILLDCGPGIALALSSLMDPGQLSAVFISHLHLDHCYDLLPIGKSLLTRHLSYPTGADAPGLSGELSPVPLYVPAGGADVLRRLADLFPVRTVPLLDKAFELAFDVQEYSPGDEYIVDDAKVSLHELRHTAQNCGIRIECGEGSLAYTGDTGMTDALTPFAAGADLLLAEATLKDTDPGPHGHLSAADAGQAAREAGVGELVLTHFNSADSSWLRAQESAASTVFSGPVHIAQPGRQFEISPTRKAHP